MVLHTFPLAPVQSKVIKVKHNSFNQTEIFFSHTDTYSTTGVAESLLAWL